MTQPYPNPYSPPPKKGMSTGAIIATVLGSVAGGILLLIVLIGLLANGSDTSSKPKTGPTSSAPSKAAPAPSSEAPVTEEPAAEATVKVTGKKTPFVPSVLHDGGAYTSVEVTITNLGDELVSTNPLHFTITDTEGVKHAVELGVDKNQMDLLKLTRGEKATGVITGKGSFTPAYVTYTDGLFGDGIRGNVTR